MSHSKEELDAVLHWRGKHTKAIRERDALELRRRAEFDNSQAAERRVDVLEGLLFSLPEDLKALSGCENTAGVYACIDYIEQCIAGLQQVTVERAALD